MAGPVITHKMKHLFEISTLVLLAMICSAQHRTMNILWNFSNKKLRNWKCRIFKKGDLEIIRIWQSDYQVLELQNLKENFVSGKLINYVTKTRRKGKSVKIIKEAITLDPKIAKYLYEELVDSKINKRKDSNEIEDYPVGFGW